MLPVAVGTADLLLSSLLLIDVGRRVARRVAPADPLLAALTTVAVATGLVIVLLEALGTARLLTAWSPLTAAVATWVAVVLIDRYRPAPPAGSEPALAGVRGLLTVDASPWVLIPAAVAVTLAVAAAMTGVWEPKSNFDAMSRHLPIAVGWLQSGSVAEVPALWGQGLTAAYPANSELLALWLLLPLHRDFLVQLATLPALALLVLGVAAAARRLGATPVLALAASLLIPSLPMVLDSQIGTNLTDLLGAGGLAASAAYLASAGGERRRAMLAMAGVCAGIAAGTRYSVATAAIPLVLVAVAPALSARAGRRAITDLGVFAIPLLALCGFWYARNAISLGDPLYPQSLPWHHVQGPLTIPLTVKTSFLAVGWNPQLWRQAVVLCLKLGGPIALALTLAAPLPLIAAVVRRERRLLLWVWAIYPALELVLYLGLPFGENVTANLRYLLPTWVAAVPLLAVMASHLRPDVQRAAAAGTLGVAALSGILQTTPRSPALLIGAAAIVVIAAYLSATRSLPARPVLASAIAAAVVAVAASPALAAHYDKRRSSLPFAAVAAHMTADDHNVTVAGFCQLYALYGPELDRQVDYTTGTGDLVNPVPSTYGDWIQALRRRGTTTVVLGRDVCFTNEQVPQAVWVRDNPEIFRPLYSDATGSAYRLAP